MKRSFSTLLAGGICAAVAATSGCTPSNKVPGGAPLLVSFVVVDPTGAALDLAPDDVGTPPLVPPLSTFYALFDRLLDPSSLETIDPDGGAITPNAGVAVVDWSGGSVASHTLYVPNGDAKLTLIPAAFGVPFANGPSITVSSSQDNGLPSGSQVTVALDPTKVRSHDQTTPFKVDDGVGYPLTFDTEPLKMVSIDVPVAPMTDAGSDDAAAADDAGAGDGGTGTNPPPPVATDYVAHVLFNNLTADATMAQIKVTRVDGTTPVAGVVVARDQMAPAGWTVSPPPDGWPPGAGVIITVTGAAVDNFGRTLKTAFSASFTVAP